MNSSLRNFSIMKAFLADCHMKKAAHVIQVNWEPPECGWVKCSTDVAAVNDGFLRAACNGTFWDYCAAIMGCFCISLGWSMSFETKLFAIMNAIESNSSNAIYYLYYCSLEAFE